MTLSGYFGTETFTSHTCCVVIREEVVDPDGDLRKFVWVSLWSLRIFVREFFRWRRSAIEMRFSSLELWAGDGDEKMLWHGCVMRR